MNAANDIEPVVVFSGTAWQAEMVKSLLEDAEINAYLMDEYTGTRRHGILMAVEPEQ